MKIKTKAQQKDLTHELHIKAREARENAHAPYSKRLVGAAIRTSTGDVFSGCNVENASYGGTVCAERVAIWKAVSELGSIEISELVVITDAKEAWPPCGFCRQVLAEFANAKTIIHTGDLKKIQKTFSFKELLPESFNPSHLK
ncbi:MAG: cytidine deaminase [Bdellovibrio sp. CG10_big_fil_rev_8_21_14_0_10_47_8]|nr:MAG: cytidine deaminase [Bdellovibrio sp. CG10_big_fil_rev_8_21_14_0_10_47_8]